MTELDLTIYAIPAFFVLMTVEWAMLAGTTHVGYERRDTIASLAMGTVNVVISVFTKAAHFLLLALVGRWALVDIEPSWSSWLVLLVLGDLCYYWFHRLSHENGLVWRVHAAHHSAPRLYWLNATRFHPLDLFALITCQTAPLILLGAGPPTLLAYGLFTGAYGQLQHCNVAVRTGPLRFLFATPEIHRWHHSTDPREGNNNYGAVLSTWDLLFGTFFYPGDRAFTGPVGLHDLPNFPRGYLGQLLSPIRWRAARGRRLP